jgi:hypothetical protein
MAFRQFCHQGGVDEPGEEFEERVKLKSDKPGIGSGGFEP